MSPIDVVLNAENKGQGFYLHLYIIQSGIPSLLPPFALNGQAPFQWLLLLHMVLNMLSGNVV